MSEHQIRLESRALTNVRSPSSQQQQGQVAQDPPLHPRFRPRSHYDLAAGSNYRVLPLRFTELDDARFVATNFSGEHVVLEKGVLRDFVRGRLPREHPSYLDLKARHFLMESDSDVALELLAAQYRTRQSLLAEFTALHMFVVTLRCDHSCPYCQVSRVSEDRAAFDMTPEMADRSIGLMFRSPSRRLKVEFQGGEPLLNFDLIRQVVTAVEARSATEMRSVEFVVATNLAFLDDAKLAFMREHRVQVSTSLDGPRDLHNANRPRPEGDSYERALAGIAKAREVLGHASVAALMTTTQRSLDRPEEIVDEFVRQGFESIFLRWMSPYGFAAKSARRIGYSSEAWQEFYRRGLLHVVRLAKAGIRIREEYAAIILRRLLTPYATGYVDLQSPTGLGISAVVYNYDGDVYMSDEGRMIAEMRDRTFRLGSVLTDTYEEIFYSERLQDLVMDTMSEGIPQCADCAFQPTCGTDPTFHHVTQGDVVGHRPTSEFCSRNMFVMRLLVSLLEDDPETAAVLRGWAW